MIYDLLSRPYPWYVAGPLLGLMVPALFFIGNRAFGISASFTHACSAVLPKKISPFNYDWKKTGGWNLQLVLGIILGGILAQFFIPEGYTVNISPDTKEVLRGFGISNFTGYVPVEIFTFENVLSVYGFIILIAGGFLIGFGTQYAKGCTSGHAITGLANLQKASLIAVIGFFIGGLISTWIILPAILN